MSKKVKVQTLQPVANGPVYGQKARTTDFNNLQTFARQHVETLTKDFLIAAKGTIGFGATAVGGTTRQIVVHAPGRAYDANGLQYDLAADVTLTFVAADTQPRIDVVAVTLDAEVPTESTSVPFARIRTQAELEQNTAPFVPTQYNVPTQLANTATLRVIKGTAAAVPVAPAIAANEVALYQVAVAANSAAVLIGDLTDVRPGIRTVYDLQTQLNTLSNIIKMNGAGTSFLANDGVYKTLTASVISDFNTAADARADLRIAALPPNWSVIGSKPTNLMAIGGTVTNSPSIGSLLLVGASGILSQDSLLFFDATNKRLGLGTSTPRRRVDTLDTSGVQMRASYTDNAVYTDFGVDSNGKLTVAPTGNRIDLRGAVTSKRYILSPNPTYTLQPEDSGMLIYSVSGYQAVTVLSTLPVGFVIEYAFEALGNTVNLIFGSGVAIYFPTGLYGGANGNLVWESGALRLKMVKMGTNTWTVLRYIGNLHPSSN